MPLLTLALTLTLALCSIHTALGATKPPPPSPAPARQEEEEEEEEVAPTTARATRGPYLSSHREGCVRATCSSKQLARCCIRRQGVMSARSVRVRVTGAGGTVVAEIEGVVA